MQPSISDTHVVMWTQDRVKWLRRVGDEGPLEVIFGGPHLSQPSIDNVRVGDVICPLAATNGRLFILGKLLVQQLLDPDEFVERQLGLKRGAAATWNEFRTRLPDGGRGVGHRIPHTCADLAAWGSGSSLQWDRVVPPEVLESLRFGPKPGRETSLKGVEGGILKRASSFHGHVRRASKETGELLRDLIGPSTALTS
jgi:hypothetical protein